MQEGVTETVVPSHNENEPTFFNSLVVKNFELGIGDSDDVMYYSAVNDVDCTDLICNKTISYVGAE